MGDRRSDDFEAVAGNLHSVSGRFSFLYDWRFRCAVAVVLAVVGCSAFYASKHLSVPEDIELNVVADQGEATVGLAPSPDGVSPACGCMDPSFAKLPWSGITLPTSYFDLGVDAQASDGFDGRRWQLTAFQPPQDVINWLSTPEQTLLMRVSVYRDGKTVQLFRGRTTFLDLIASEPVEVEQDRRFPYAALLPAGGGSTTVDSEAPARPGEGGSLTVESDAPARPKWTSEHRRWWLDPELVERGPMVDVIGKTRFRLERAGDAQVYAGVERIRGIQPGDQLEITLRTPFSLRLVPSPAPRQWIHQMKDIWNQHLLDISGPRSKYGPALVGRYLVTEPLPGFSMRLSDARVAEAGAWSKFAGRSARQDVVGSMLKGDPKAGDQITFEAFGLPPVTTNPEVGVFGNVTHFTSDSLRGELALGASTSPISRGQLITVESAAGLEAGKYRYTGLISAGEPSKPTSLSGSAEVSVDGDPRTKVSWLSWLAGAAGVALVGIALGALIAWLRRGRGEAR